MSSPHRLKIGRQDQLSRQFIKPLLAALLRQTGLSQHILSQGAAVPLVVEAQRTVRNSCQPGAECTCFSRFPAFLAAMMDGKAHHKACNALLVRQLAKPLGIQGFRTP
jgi:hypothetical protein